MRKAYTEVLDVVEDVVVQGEVAAGDAVNASILLDLPVGKAETLSLSEEIGLGDLAAPVCGGGVSFRAESGDGTSGGELLTSLRGLLQVTVDSHAGETENGRLNHLAGYTRYSGGRKQGS